MSTTPPIDLDALEALEALAKAATSVGEWTYEEPRDAASSDPCEREGTLRGPSYVPIPDSIALEPHDARYVVAACNAVPELIARLRSADAVGQALLGVVSPTLEFEPDWQGNAAWEEVRTALGAYIFAPTPRVSDHPAPTLSVVEAAQRLKVRPAMVRRWITEGRLAATRSGKSYRVAISEVERMKREAPPRCL